MNPLLISIIQLQQMGPNPSVIQPPEPRSNAEENEKNGQPLPKKRVYNKNATNKIERRWPQQFNSSDYVKKMNHSIAEIEPRDQIVVVEVPESMEGEELEEWIGTACNMVFSSGFNLFKSKQLQFEQAKVFCAEQILQNIAFLAASFELEPEHMKRINNFMSGKVMPYLKLKYPMSLNQTANKALSERIKETDLLSGEYENDFVFKSQVMFELRTSGNYQDLIMSFINEVLFQVDKNQNFIAFEKEMKKLFLIIDLDPHPQQDIASNLKKNAERYKEKVKSYTQWSINRKVSKDIKLFSEPEIKNKHLEVRSGSVLRILVKWCEQLRKKFETKGQFLDNLKLLKQLGSDKEKRVTQAQIEELQIAVEKQKLEIDQFLQEILKNSYNLELVLLLQEFRSKDGHLEMPAFQKICGKFSVKMIKLFHNYVVQYLNRLIHGLLTVAKSSLQEIDKKFPCLLSFTLGDIMRCKCTSKQDEILRIYEELKKLEEKGTLKIVLQKNRLEKEARDILIIFEFREVLCEIQFAINTTQLNKFQKCSNSFNHFLYEIERNPFGPILEICSVWQTYEKRAAVYKSIINKQQKKGKWSSQGRFCPSGSSERAPHDGYINETMPFLCSSCRTFFPHSNFIFPSKKCGRCLKYWKCTKCQLSEDSCSLEKPLLKSCFQKFDYQIQYSVISYPGILSQYGACINIEQQMIKVEPFQIKKEGRKTLLFSRPVGQQETHLIKDLTTPQNLQDFLAKYIIASQSKEIIDTIQEKDIKPDVRKHIFAEETNLSVLKQKDKLSFNDREINDSEIQCIITCLTDKNYATHITTLKLAQNKISQLGSICQKLGNLKCLDISENNDITNYQPLKLLKNLAQLNLNINKSGNDLTPIMSLQNLKSLSLEDQKLMEIPMMIHQLSCLTQLSLCKNGIETLPLSLFALKNLKLLELDNNQLGEFSTEINQLTKLQDLRFSSNKIVSIQPLKNMLSLRMLFGIQNQIKEVPDLSALKNLQEFWFDKNKIVSLQGCFKDLSLLQNMSLCENDFNLTQQLELQPLYSVKYLDISENNIYGLPKNFESFRSLENLQASKNKLSKIPIAISKLKELKLINLEQNQIQKIPTTLCRLEKLETLNLKSNKLKKIPNEIGQITSLENLNLQNNQIEEIPRKIKFCFKMTFLNLMNNKIKTIPKELDELTRLRRKNHLLLYGNQITAFECVDFLIDFGDEAIKQQILRRRREMEVNKLLEFCASKVVPQDNSFARQTILVIYPLSSLPTNFSRLTSLSELYLTNTKLRDIPGQICNLVSLRKLDVSSTEITKFPSSLSLLSNLKVLIASFNNFSANNSLDSISKLKIRVLALAHCKITILPPNFQGLSTLQNLDLNGNVEMTVEDKFPFKNLKVASFSSFKCWQIETLIWKWRGARKIYINDVGLRQIPKNINHLQQLEMLSCSQNPIGSIHHQITQLKQLRSLSLSSCTLSDQEVYKLKQLHQSLTYLDLSDNNIINITFICQLVLLEKLNLANNQIYHVPFKLTSLTKLQKGQLYLDDNPLTVIHCSDFVLQTRHTPKEPIILRNQEQEPIRSPNREQESIRSPNREQEPIRPPIINEMEDEDYT